MTIPSIRTGISATAMPDVQASRDVRRIAIDRVGVKDVTYPIRLRTKDGGEQTTVASINMYVALPDHQKGTHMSRFLEVLNEQTCEPLTPDKIPAIARAICESCTPRWRTSSAPSPTSSARRPLSPRCRGSWTTG